MLDPLAEDVDDPPLGDLTLEPVEELLAGRPVVLQVERLDGLGLRRLEEGQQVIQVEGMIAVVVFREAGEVAGLLDQGPDDQGFKALFRGVRRHGGGPSSQPSRWSRSQAAWIWWGVNISFRWLQA